MGTEQILDERLKTHGDFSETATIIQATKSLWQNQPGWRNLTLVQRETLDMIAHKVGRILCGDPNLKDHWDDIAGYSVLVSQRIK